MLYYDRSDISGGIDINRQVHLKNVLFVTIGIFRDLLFVFL